MLVHEQTFKYLLPQCSESFTSSDLTHLEFFISDIATKSRVIQMMRLGDNMPFSLRTNKNTFLRRLGLMRNLRVLDADALVCNSDDLEMITSNFPLLT
jgi:hypothetical protein